MSPYYNEARKEYEDMYIVRCMHCGNVGMLEYTEDEALEEWNRRNTKYILRGSGMENI